MKFRQIIFNQFLLEKEVITRSFRCQFPFFKFIIWGTLFFLLAWLLGFLLFIDNEVYKNYAYLAISFLAVWKLGKIFFEWYTNTILITSETLLFIEWKSFFSPKHSRLDYWDMDMIDIERKGLRSYTNNTGNLIFNKISGGEPFVFYNIFRPHHVEKILTEIREKILDDKNFTEESALKDLISQLVQTHVRKNDQPVRDSMIRGNNAKNENNLQTKPKITKKDNPKKYKHFESDIEIEKKLDDTGGIEIDL